MSLFSKLRNSSLRHR